MLIALNIVMILISPIIISFVILDLLTLNYILLPVTY